MYNVVTRIRKVSLSLSLGSIQNNIDVMRPTVTTAHTLSAVVFNALNPLNAELNRICHLLALFGAHHILHVSRIRVNALWAVAGYNTPTQPLLQLS